MKTFQVKYLQKGLLALSLGVFALIIIFMAFLLLPLFLRKGFDIEACMIVLVMSFFPIGLLIRKLCTRKWEIEVDSQLVSIKRNGRYEEQFPHHSITMLQFIPSKDESMSPEAAELFIHRKYRNRIPPPLRFNGKKELLLEVCRDICSYGTYEREYEKKHGTILYVSQKVVETDCCLDKQAARTAFSSKKILAAMVAVAFSMLMIPGLLMYLNLPKEYNWQDGVLYYGNDPVEGATNPEELTFLYLSLCKDSSHVYYKSRILEWADAATFTYMGRSFYKDKNGFYYEKTGLFSPSAILPLKGDYDWETFREVGEDYFFKDKNHVYEFNLQFIHINYEPLRKVDIPGLDAATFEKVTNGGWYWYQDKNRIYFKNNQEELVVCSEIDRDSFEVISSYFAKDKNHVYYMTFYLTDNVSDAETKKQRKKTSNSGYQIVPEIDAATFEMIDPFNYQDKNSTYVIER